MPTDTHRIVISADKTPIGEHMRRYNAPTIDEVAIVMVGHQFLPRDIILHKRNAQLVRMAETHRCYDALQYPCRRLYTIHPNQHECFFLRLLFLNVPGPTSFEYLGTVNGTIHDTYRSACQALNLLENDQHWDNCINDACETSTPSQIRVLFGIILTLCYPSAPTELWDKYKSKMT